MSVLGGRYGSLEHALGKSYVKLENEYAVTSIKPLFAAVIAEEYLEARVKAQGLRRSKRLTVACMRISVPRSQAGLEWICPFLQILRCFGGKCLYKTPSQDLIRTESA